MINRKDYKQAISVLGETSDANAVYEAMDRLTRVLGFERYAISHHVDLLHPPAGAYGLTDYESDWLNEIVTEQYYLDDPIQRLCDRRNCGFLWPDPASLLSLTPRQRHILDQGAKHNLRGGYTVPMYLPGEYAGSCTFATAHPEALAPNALPSAFFAASFAFEAIRRIARLRSGLALPTPPGLRRRERQVLILMGRGKTYREIGEILGLSAHTAHEYAKRILLAYGNIHRNNLIARALFDGIVTYPELLSMH
ncbi:LuxR family transcriptional regulator [Novosphingobium resinovorum]|uniref:helix-turn-helix transcriptional regulator n=1 Tax=Novosphingobium TaxID=165696 RepID=UPI002004AAFE|nr:MULTISPECIES: LuxR family transcriptional regulator [Novosphingobium]WJM25884.1 LuxR family transcriptional regulator [Novosphingobium resinovorum]